MSRARNSSQRSIERAAAKDTCTDEIPEGRADDIGVGQPVLDCMMRLDQAVIVDRLDDQEHQRQHLDERSMLPIGTHMLGRPPNRGDDRCR